MTWRLACLVLLSLTLAGLGACLNQDDSAAPGENATVADELIGNFDHALISGDVEVHNATLVGTMGDVEGLRHYATAVDAFSDGQWLSLHVTVDTGIGAAMTIVDVWDLAQLDMMDTGSAVQPGISIIGCSGDEPGMWDFDQAADEVDVDVLVNPANPDEITLNYTATYIDYGSYYMDGDAYYANPGAVSDLPRTTVSGTVSFMRPAVTAGSQYGNYYDGDAPSPVAGTSNPW